MSCPILVGAEVNDLELMNICRSLSGGCVEDKSWVARCLSLQVPFYRLCQQNLPPQCWWSVSWGPRTLSLCTKYSIFYIWVLQGSLIWLHYDLQVRLSLSGCYQPDLEPHVWYDPLSIFLAYSVLQVEIFWKLTLSSCLWPAPDFTRSCQCVWSVSSSTSSVCQPFRSIEWRSCCSDDAWQSYLWTKS